MAIAQRFRHVLTLSRLTTTGAADGRGHRTSGYVDDETSINGNVQERRSREVATGQTEGVAISDAIAFLPIAAATTSLRPADRLKRGAAIYQLVGLPRDAGGRGRHLEVDLRRVTP